MAKQNALESDRREAFLSRVALRTDYKNGFSLFEFIVQIVEIVASFHLVLFGLSRFGASG